MLIDSCESTPINLICLILQAKVFLVFEQFNLQFLNLNLLSKVALQNLLPLLIGFAIHCDALVLSMMRPLSRVSLNSLTLVILYSEVHN